MEVWRPSTTDVGSLVRARTVDTNGRELGTFTDDTRPTGVELTDLVDTAVADLKADVGQTIPDAHVVAARRVAALGVAMQVELTYWPEEAAAANSVYDRLEKLYETRLARLLKAIQDDDGDPSTDDNVLSAYGSFDDIPLIGNRTQF